MITDVELGDLTSLWEERWSPCPPIAHQLRSVHRDRWVRFHSLPGSKRYADTPDEWEILLERHYTVLRELFAGSEIMVFSCDWSDSAKPPDPRARTDAGARWWRSMLTNDDPDPEFRVFTHWFASRSAWEHGSLDALLHAVATWERSGIMISDPGLTRIYHPYDGGADVLLRDSAERDALRERYSAWLSAHPSGL